MGRLIAILGALALASCRSGPVELSVEAPRGQAAFDRIAAAMRVLFPQLTTCDAESGWIVSAPHFFPDSEAGRRARVFAQVFGARAARRAQVRLWVEREVFTEGSLLGLLGYPGWAADGRDAALEEELRRLLVDQFPSRPSER